MRNYILTILCIIIISACNKTEGDLVLTSFKQKVELTSTGTQVNSDDIGVVMDLISFDSLLILCEYRSESVFKYFNLKNGGEKVGEFIKIGRGPNEIILPGTLHKFNENVFYMYERQKKELIFFNLPDILNGDYTFNKVIDVNFPDFKIFKSYPINDSLLLMNGAIEDKCYSIYNIQQDKSIIGVDFPNDKLHKKEPSITKAYAHQGEVSIKPDKKAFVFATSGGYFDICIWDSDEIKLKKRNLYYLPEYHIVGGDSPATSSESKSAFRSVKSTNDYIYMVYSGRTYDEAGSSCSAGKNVLVYDWDGNPVVNFELDRYLYRMTLDEKNLIIYGYSINPISGESEIIKYKLPDLKSVNI